LNGWAIRFLGGSQRTPGKLDALTPLRPVFDAFHPTGRTDHAFLDVARFDAKMSLSDPISRLISTSS
jgi:hypothetical protein